MHVISSVYGRQILDSRGRPTVEVDVVLADGSAGQASSPSGASKGKHEAAELRDGDPQAFAGRGVRRAVANVNGEIAKLLVGRSVFPQHDLDRDLVELDGTPNLSRLGGNAILATSLAAARAGASNRRQPLHLYIASMLDSAQPSLPLPMVNILSGGAHAGRGMDFQDFLVIPVGARSYSEALEIVGRVRSSAAELLAEEGRSVLLADEGGLSPGYPEATQALDLMVRSFERAEVRPGEDAAIGVDVAASELISRDGGYELAKARKHLKSMEMIDLLVELSSHYPIVSIEDGLHQDDWDNWPRLTDALGHLQLVGDDLFVTNTARIHRGIAAGIANAVLIKPNQNGTLTGTLEAMAVARAGGYKTVVSARSGETEDAFIADLAAGTGAGQIKIGSLRNSERLSKYNQLLRLEEFDLPWAGWRPQ